MQSYPALDEETDEEEIERYGRERHEADLRWEHEEHLRRENNPDAIH